MVSELWQKEAPPCAFFPSLPTLRINCTERPLWSRKPAA